MNEYINEKQCKEAGKSKVKAKLKTFSFFLPHLFLDKLSVFLYPIPPDKIAKSELKYGLLCLLDNVIGNTLKNISTQNAKETWQNVFKNAFMIGGVGSELQRLKSMATHVFRDENAILVGERARPLLSEHSGSYT